MKEGWEKKKLGEVICPKTEIKRASQVFNENDEILYYDISSIDNDLKKISSACCYTIKEAPSRAQQKVEEGDILYSLVRPNLKNIAVVKSKEQNLVASSGFCVIRTKELCNRNYVFYFVNSSSFTDKMCSLAAGANYPAVKESDIKDTFIPVPPLSVQESIVSELDILSGIISKHKALQEEYDRLEQSIFYDMFGDPVTNEKGWDVKKLEDVCEKITDGDHMPPPKSETGIPFITISDIDKDKRVISFNKTFYVPESYYDSLKDIRKAKVNDLLYTVTGSYGIPVIIRDNRKFCFQRHIALIRAKEVELDVNYLCHWFLCPSVKQMADNVATGIAQKTVSLNSIRNFEIITPPLSLQQSFADKISVIEQMKAKNKAAQEEAEMLFNERMAYYF